MLLAHISNANAKRWVFFFVFFFHALNLNFYSEPRQAPSQEKKTEACSSNAIHSLSSIPNSDSLTGSQQKLQVINLVDSSAVNQAPCQEKETEACSSNTISSSSSIPNSDSLTDSQQQPQAINLVDLSAVTEPLTHETPAQNQVKGDITTLESKIASLNALKESGFATAENTKHLKDSQVHLKQAKQQLKALMSDANKQCKQCVVKKVVTELASLSTANASKLTKFTHSTTGRPPLQDTYPDFHKTIVDL